MSKRQVVLMSFVVAIPSVLLLTMLVFNGMEHGGKMFSGLMTVIVGLTALLVLGLGLSPLAVMAFYPAEGFQTMMPVPPPESSGSPMPAGGDDVAVDDDEFGDDGDGFEDDGGFDDGYDDSEYASSEDDGLFEEGYDDEDYDDGLFEDDEEWT